MAFTEQQLQTLKLLLETQSDGYKDAISRLHADFKEIRKDHEELIYELRKSLEFTQRETDDIKKEITQVRIENAKLNAVVDLHTSNHVQTENQIKDLVEKIDQMDDRSRGLNLVFSGIPETHGENNQQCNEKTRKVMKEKLEIPNPDFNTVFRMGKPESGRIRDILVKFNSMDQRNTVLKKKRLLKCQQIFIREDYCKSTIQIRNTLLPKLQEARRQGKFAYLNYRELIIKNDRGTSMIDKDNGDKTRVKKAVNVIEQSLDGAKSTSPLPSPFLAPMQATDLHTPPRRPKERSIQGTSQGNVAQLRPREQKINYPK